MMADTREWYFARLSKTFGWRYVTLVVLIYGINQGLGEGWGFFAKEYFFSDDPPKGLGLSAAKSGSVSGLINLPWQIKSIYGILSDALPIRRYHRTPYLIFAGILGTFGWLALGSFPVGLLSASLLMILANYSIASPDVMIDASVAENCNQHPAFATDLQSLCWGSYGVGAIIASLSVGWLYDSPIGSRGIFALTAITSVVVVVPAVLGWLGEEADQEADIKKHRLRTRIKLRMSRALSCICGKVSQQEQEELHEQMEQEMVLLPPATVEAASPRTAASEQLPVPTLPPPGGAEAVSSTKNDNLFLLSILLCVISISVGSSLTYFDNGGIQLLAYVAAVAGVCMSVYGLEKPISENLAKASIYIFLRAAIQPDSSIVYYWSKYNEENCEGEYTDRPCFSPEFLSTMEVVGYVFFVVGTAVYNMYLSNWSYRKIWTVTQIALIFANLIDFVWVMRWNLNVGISDRAFMVGDEVIGKMISRLNTMPLFILAAKLCPKGYEATLFAMNMGLSNFGGIMGTYLGSILLEFMSVKRPEFQNLGLYVFVRSITRILPVFLIPLLVPHGKPNDDDHIIDAQPITSTEGVDEQDVSLLSQVPSHDDIRGLVQT